MRSRLIRTAAVVAMLMLPGMASAQFGHPLKGQWSGEWVAKGTPQRLLLDLHWDGKAITGVINPGTDPATVQNVTFDYSNPSAWKVKLEAERKDPSGKPVRILVDGTLENIGAYYRVFHGTWTEGGQSGDFTVTRN
jgi:hypothetical protein